MEGYIKLWRKSIDKGWLRNHKLWAFWTYCLMMAAGLDGNKLEKYSQITLKRGQFIFGLKKAVKDTGLTYQCLRTCLAKLEKWGNINKQSNNQFSVITILKYESYNPIPPQGNNQANKQLTIKQQSTNKQLTTIKKVNKVNNYTATAVGEQTERVSKGPLDAIILTYQLEKRWVKVPATLQGRLRKAAKELYLTADKDTDAAQKAIGWLRKEFQGRGLDWKLETVVNRFPDYMKYKKRMDKDYG